jgi:hypothetical protein
VGPTVGLDAMQKRNIGNDASNDSSLVAVNGFSETLPSNDMRIHTVTDGRDL